MAITAPAGDLPYYVDVADLGGIEYMSLDGSAQPHSTWETDRRSRRVVPSPQAMISFTTRPATSVRR